MSALDELMSNQNWMIHDLVDGDQIDNDEEKRLRSVYEAARAELAALRAERDNLRKSLAKALMILSMDGCGIADEIAERHFETWNEIRQLDALPFTSPSEVDPTRAEIVGGAE